jgi:hypothetical protein
LEIVKASAGLDRDDGSGVLSGPRDEALGRTLLADDAGGRLRSHRRTRRFPGTRTAHHRARKGQKREQ